MGLSEQLQGWTPYDAGGFTKSYYKSNRDGTLKAYVRSLASPGEWYVIVRNFVTGERKITSRNRETCFTSLMDALFYGDAALNEHERL
jgi:hypothetical protein